MYNLDSKSLRSYLVSHVTYPTAFYISCPKHLMITVDSIQITPHYRHFIPPRLPILPIRLHILILRAPANLIHLLPNHRIHILIRLPAHPTIQMSIALHHMAFIFLRPKSISQNAVCFVRAFGIQHLVVGAREEHYGDVFQAVDILGRREILEEGRVGGYTAAHTHLHEEVQQRHVHAAEETVDLAVGCFIEVAVVPASIKVNVKCQHLEIGNK